MNINVVLDEPLTTNNSVKLVIELLKYVLYRKQQIPFTYDSLMQLQRKPPHRNSSSIKALLNILKSTTEHLNSQFHLEGCKVKEVAILIGATVILPKLCIRVEFPSNILSSQEHFECTHTSKKALLSLMRSMSECAEFQDALALPLNPTNTFILLQKSDSNLMSDYFLPEPQYELPVHISNYFIIKLQHNDQIKSDCNCINMVKVYNDISESHSKKTKSISILNNADVNHKNIPYQWYQSREIIKGFKVLR